MSESPVYMIVELDITEPDRFWSEYAAELAPIHARHGVEVVLGGPPIAVVEGEVAQNFVAVLKFPSAAAQRAWYDDPEYQPLKTRRFETTNTDSSRVLLAPAFAPQA